MFVVITTIAALLIAFVTMIYTILMYYKNNDQK